MYDLPEAGVGMIYLPGLESLMESHFHLLNVIEIEPQTLWQNKEAKCDSFTFNIDQTHVVKEYPIKKLFHSVGCPVGGTVMPPKAFLKLLNEHADLLSPLWISEHLSFNAFSENGKVINTNFLLPPLQTREGIDTAVRSINHFTSEIKLPFAFETGVNYLKPRKYEIPDGQFVFEIATKANCNILLDLHNIMANQLNGRQPVIEFINQLPMDRICEIHIAGGFFYNGYYLDGHSGISSKELFELLDKVVRKLPNLKALIFEMLPEYVNDITEEAMNFQLEKMHRTWDNRGKNLSVKKWKAKKKIGSEINEQSCLVKDWEYGLGKAAIKQPLKENKLSIELAEDRGLIIINELIFHFRASMLITALKLSTRCLRLSLGSEIFKEGLKKFFAYSLPELFPFALAQKYARYVREIKYEIPYLDKILEFEMACLSTMIDNKTRTVEFGFNPFPVMRSLSKSELPKKQDANMAFCLEIKSEQLTRDNESLNFAAVYHN